MLKEIFGFGGKADNRLSGPSSSCQRSNDVIVGNKFQRLGEITLLDLFSGTMARSMITDCSRHNDQRCLVEQPGHSLLHLMGGLYLDDFGSSWWLQVYRATDQINHKATRNRFLRQGITHFSRGRVAYEPPGVNPFAGRAGGNQASDLSGHGKIVSDFSLC